METYIKLLRKAKRRYSAWLLSMSRYVVIVNFDGKRVVHNASSVCDAVSWLACYDSKTSCIVVDTWLRVTVAGRRGVA